MTIKKFIRENLLAIYRISILITMISIQAAYEHRGYFALGGEILIPLIPVMMHIWIVMEE